MPRSTRRENSDPGRTAVSARSLFMRSFAIVIKYDRPPFAGRLPVVGNGYLHVSVAVRIFLPHALSRNDPAEAVGDQGKTADDEHRVENRPPDRSRSEIDQ